MDATDMTLDEIMIQTQSDKASVFTRTYAKPKSYCRHYEKLFASLRDQPIKLLEVGVGGGESIRGWLQYFPNARVFGVDNVHDTNPWDTPCTNPAGGANLERDRYTFVYGDQSSDTFWQCFIADYGRDWDIVIDDGGHYSHQIIATFNALWPMMKQGGFYGIEDLGVAYGDGSFVTPGTKHHMDWLRLRLDHLNTSSDIDSIYFARELAVIRKAL